MYSNLIIRPCKPKWIERKNYETLSSSSKNFERDTYKGGSAPPPFVGFSATQNCSDSHFGLQGLSTITFGGPWTYSQITLRDFLMFYILCIGVVTHEAVMEPFAVYAFLIKHKDKTF